MLLYGVFAQYRCVLGKLGRFREGTRFRDQVSMGSDRFRGSGNRFQVSMGSDRFRGCQGCSGNRFQVSRVPKVSGTRDLAALNARCLR